MNDCVLIFFWVRFMDERMDEMNCVVMIWTIRACVVLSARVRYACVVRGQLATPAASSSSSSGRSSW